MAAATALAAAPLAAQETSPQQPAETPPTQAQVQTAAQHYSVIAGALQSEDLESSIKNQLFMCLYSASVRQISDAVTQVIAQNEQLSADNAEHVQTAIGAVCGVRAPEGEAAATPDAPAGETPEGR
ncbi:MAG: hypothetical protein LC634_09360 [Sphingomonadales bacterium]|nr:hypothetical protein [Sphingomonadales bacterium]